MNNPPSFTYTPALDGIRGISILLVFMFHAFPLRGGFPNLPWKGGFLGVDVFFVMSGYLITRLLIQEWETTETIDFRAFFWRRALRLFPALAVVLLFCGGMAFVAPAGSLERTQIFNAIVSTTFYYANWMRAYQVTTHEHSILVHTWSLSIEEQFYLIWPLLFFGFLRLKSRPQTIVLVTLVLLVAAQVQRFWLMEHHASIQRLYNGLDTRADGLLIGCLTGMAAGWGMFPGLLKLLCRQSIQLAAIGGFLTLWLVLTEADPRTYLGGITAASGCTAIIIIGVSDFPSEPLKRLCLFPPLIFIGRMSYGLYLWHLPVFTAVQTWFDTIHLPQYLFMLFLPFLVATLSFLLIEAPLLRLKRKRLPTKPEQRPFHS